MRQKINIIEGLISKKKYEMLLPECEKREQAAEEYIKEKLSQLGYVERKNKSSFLGKL